MAPAPPPHESQVGAAIAGSMKPTGMNGQSRMVIVYARCAVQPLESVTRMRKLKGGSLETVQVAWPLIVPDSRQRQPGRQLIGHEGKL